MKAVFFGILLTTALSCGSASDNKKQTALPAPAADPASQSGFLLSDQAVFAVKIVWTKPPVSQSFDNSAEVYFQDKSGQPITSSRLTRFHLYMASMGHPSIKESEMVFQEIEPGHWNVSRIFFSMGGSAGSWLVDLEAEANGQPDHIRVSIDHEVE